MGEIDTARVICALHDIPEQGSRGFTMGAGDWPLRGLVVRTRSSVRAYVNRCPHAGHPLNFKPDQFLTPDNLLILCSSHGALFEKLTGYCVSGPCMGRTLDPIDIVVDDGFVMLAEGESNR